MWLHSLFFFNVQNRGIINPFFKIVVQLMYNVVLISTVQQSDSIIHILLHIFFHYGLSQDIKYSPGPCCLSEPEPLTCAILPLNGRTFRLRY